MSITNRIFMAAAAALVLVGCNPATSSNGDDPITSLSTPTDVLLAGSATTVSIAKGYNNAYSGDLTIALNDKQTDTGYTDVAVTGTNNTSLGLAAGDWTDPGLTLGTKSVAFELASTKGADNADGHVVLSFQGITGLSHAGATGLTFTLKFTDAPDASGLGLMPHLRYNDGSSENATAFGAEVWYFKTDPAYFVVKVPFAAFGKPGYGLQSQTSIAAYDAADGHEFNQIDFDIRIQNAGGGGFVEGTKYHAIIDNVGYYTDPS